MTKCYITSKQHLRLTGEEKAVQDHKSQGDILAIIIKRNLM